MPMSEADIRTAVALIFTPANAINAFAAMIERNSGRPFHCIVAICRFPSQNDADAAELESAIRGVLRSFPQVTRIVNFDDQQLAGEIALGGQAFISLIGSRLGQDLIDDIYYAHDVVGIIYQSICLAHPNAVRILFGDGFGWIHHRDDAQPDTPSSLSVAVSPSRWWQWIKTHNANRSEQPVATQWSWEYVRALEFSPSELCTTLPIEKSTHLSKIAPVHVVPRGTTLELLECVGHDLEASRHEAALIQQIGARRCILLVMGNWVEAAMASADGEIGIYMDMLAPHLTKECVVLAKPHPGSASTAWRFEQLARQLDGKAELIAFPAQFHRLPLELFGNVLRQCVLVAHSSVLYSARYFYGVNAQSALTRTAIEAYTRPKFHALLGEQVDLDARFVRALRRWDGRGVIMTSKENRLRQLLRW